MQTVFRLFFMSFLAASIVVLWTAAAEAGLLFRTVALSGTPAPGAPSGENFRALGFELPVLNSHGRTAFRAQTENGFNGIWSEGSGNVRPTRPSNSPWLGLIR